MKKNCKTLLFISINFFLIFIISLLLVGCKTKKVDGDLQEYERVKSFEYITYYEDFSNLTRDVVTGVHYVYFGKPTCPWC